LSRELGAAGHYPAVDVLQSVSRLESQIAQPEQKSAARKIREALAVYRRSEDLINLGAYVSGTNAALDSAVRAREEIMSFLRQDAGDQSALSETLVAMQRVAGLL
jgi:flagellar biosynthesis/type III secretory pathway ATPase